MENETHTGRLYKSRKSRPCDSCRKRKVACDMPVGPPCRRCSKTRASCTFAEGPGPRKRPNLHISPEGAAAQTQELLAEGNLTFSPNTYALFFGSPPTEASRGGFAADWGPSPLNTFRIFQEDWSAGSHSSDASPAQAGSDRLPTADAASSRHSGSEGGGAAVPGASSTESLEFVPGAFSFYIGPTGVSDVHLLSHAPCDGQNIITPRVSGLKYRRLDPPDAVREEDSRPPTLFGITDKSLIDKAEPRLNHDAIDHAWTELWTLLSPDAAWNLVQLYARFVDPYFPVLSRHQMPRTPEELSNMPLALITAICATAIPFLTYDGRLVNLLLHPPSSEQLYRLCWLGLSQELHAPSLATVQAGLLLLQRLPTNYYLSDTAFTWSLVSSTLAAGQTIGLHRDPSSWVSVPLWERRLRRRLWWALWTMEKWVSLARGMPSHLPDDDYDVPHLTPGDIDDTLSDAAGSGLHFYYLATLTTILSQIQTTYYTVRGSGQTANDFHSSLEAARPIRERLKEWRDRLPSSLRFSTSEGARVAFRLGEAKADLDGNASVHLSYIVTHMSLFRAVIRPLDSLRARLLGAPEEASLLFDGARAVARGALQCVREFVEYVEALTDVQWNAFWHSWSRACFAMAGSFMVHLLHIISPPKTGAGHGYSFGEEYQELEELVRRWRWANRVAVNGAAGMKGLTNLGLLRVETLLNSLTETEQ